MTGALGGLTWGLAGLCVVAALWVVVLLILNRVAGDPLFTLLGLIEVGLIAHTVLGVVRFASDPHPGISGVTFIGYLLANLLLLPAAVVWSLAERSRGGTAVLLVGVLLVPFLFYRLAEIWPTA